MVKLMFCEFDINKLLGKKKKKNEKDAGASPKRLPLAKPEKPEAEPW